MCDSILNNKKRKKLAWYYFVCKQINHKVCTKTPRQWTFSGKREEHHDKICVYDEHPIADRDIQHRAPDSWSGYTTPFNNIIK